MRQIKAVFNGSFDSIENIKVSPFSRAYTFSDSVYEVLPFYNKKLIAFKSHIEIAKKRGCYKYNYRFKKSYR